MSKRNYPHTPVSATLTAGSDDRDNWPVVFGDEIGGTLFLFKTLKDRDDFSAAYAPRLFKSWCFVKENSSQEPAWFEWTGVKQDGTDGTWQSLDIFDAGPGGVTIVNPDGSSTTGIEMFGLQGLELQGDAQKGFNLVVTAKGSDGLTFEERVHYAEFDNIKRVLVGPGLELNATRNSADGPPTGVEIGVKPGTFQPRSSVGYLAYLQFPEVIMGKAKAGEKYRKGTLWMDMVAVHPNGMLQLDKPSKAIGLQDVNIGDDPNVTGGSNFLVWPFVYLEGEAPADGYVELVWYNKQTGVIATDVNGHAMAVRHNYKQGQTLTPKHDPLSFCQVINAKGVTEYALAVVDNFDDFIRVKDYSEGPTGICIQELSDKGSASEALTKAEIDTGFNVRVESYYAGSYLASATYLATIPEPSISVSAGSFVHSANEFEIYAITDLDFDVSGGLINIGAKDLQIGDFYCGLVVQPELARVVAGHNLTVDISLVDKNNSWAIEFYTYTGDLDKRPPLYKSRTNNTVNLESGWSKFSGGFISADVVSGIHAESFSAVVPKDADFVMVALYPTEAQNPLNLSLKGFRLDADPAVNGFEINSFKIAGLHHLDFMTENVKLVQDTQGYAALRYTINNSPDGLPMPLGIPQSKMKFLHLDAALNVISGSGAKGGEGVLVDDEPSNVTVYQKWQLYNEQASASTVDFWLEVYRDGTGVSSEVPNSRATFTVDSKRPGVDYFQTNQVTVGLEPGDYIYARAKADVADGAYAQTTSKASPLCITYVKEEGLAP